MFSPGTSGKPEKRTQIERTQLERGSTQIEADAIRTRGRTQIARTQFEQVNPEEFLTVRRPMDWLGFTLYGSVCSHWQFPVVVEECVAFPRTAAYMNK